MAMKKKSFEMILFVFSILKNTYNLVFLLAFNFLTCISANNLSFLQSLQRKRKLQKNDKNMLILEKHLYNLKKRYRLITRESSMECHVISDGHAISE